MKKFVGSFWVMALMVVLVALPGSTRAADNDAPSATTGWPIVTGTAGEEEKAVFGIDAGSGIYRFAGQEVSSSQRVPTLFTYDSGTPDTTSTNFSGGAASSFDVFDAIVPLSSGNYAWIGRKVVSAGTESRGTIFLRTATGSHVGYNHTLGEASALERLNAGIQISGATNTGNLIVAGFSNGTGATDATNGDAIVRRTTATGDPASQDVAYISTSESDEAFAVAEATGTQAYLVAGRSGDGSGGYDFLVQLLDTNLDVAGGWTAPTLTEDGTADVFRAILEDGSNDFILVGTTGTAGGSEQGYVVKIDGSTGALVAGYEFTTTATDVEFYAADLLASGDILITGRSGDDLYMCSMNDTGSGFEVDWENTYDSGQTGDIGYWVQEQGDNSILVAGVADDASSTDAAFWAFDAPSTSQYAPEVTNTDPADAATGVALTGDALSWTDTTPGGGEDAIVSVSVLLEDATPPTVEVASGVIGSTTSYTMTGLSSNTTYYWAVNTIDAEGDTTEGTIYSFTTVDAPLAPTYTSPADASTNADTAGVTLTWADPGNGTGANDDVDRFDVYFDTNATPTTLVEDSVVTTTVTHATGSLDANTTYYWYVVSIGTTGEETAGAVQSFTTLNPPNTPTITSPSDAATDQDSTGVTLTWADGSGSGDAAATWDLFFDTNTTPTTKVVDDLAQTTYATGALTGGTTYYWYAVARDADGDVAYSDTVSFTTAQPANVVYVSIDSDVATTYYDNDNVAGFHELADDAYDDYDTPEPPAFGAGYIRTYISESGFSSPFDELTEDYRDWTGKTFGTTPYLFELTTVTDEDGAVSYTVDVTNGNGNDWPVAWWDGSDFQNMNGASDEDNTASFTSAASGDGSEQGGDGTDDGLDTRDFAILIGDTTAPVVTEVFPVALGTSEIQRNDANATLEVSFDDTAPIRQVLVYFSPSDDSNSPRENWTELTNSPMTYDGTTNGSPDDPTDGVTNANLTLPWVPYVDDNALFSSPSDLFPAAQMRFISEDWMGNKDTTYVDFAITPDEFDYTDTGVDNVDYAAGWHLISVPMDPDEDLASDMFTSATGDDAGIAGDFTVFEYSASGGYEQPTVMAIAKGYWIVLDSDNSDDSGNAGLGTILGTIAGASDNVDLTLDPDSYNIVGVTVRTEDLSGGGAIQAEEWVFSDDAWTSTYTWTEATTTADKGGDTGVWIDATSLVSYDNAGGDYTAQIASTTDLDPGVGYALSVGTVTAGQLEMRTVRTDVEGDIVDPGDNGNHDLDEIDDFNGEWFIPIRTAIGDYFNEQSGFGCNLEASEGWDPGLDATNPPLPPSGHYVRAVVDGQAWEAPFGRYYVTDVRAPFEPGVTESSWTFKVYSSEHGTIAMTFDISALEEYNVPEGFTATATVNGQTFDLLQSQTISFDYDGGMVPVVIEAALASTSVGEENGLPTEYSIASAYPNPFNPSTVIRVGLPAAANMDVAVYNVLGKQVASLASGTYNAGYHNLVFDAHSMASGVYFIRASVPGKLNQVKKVVLVR